MKNDIDPFPRSRLMRAPNSDIEHLTFNQRVVGSKPAGLTNQFKSLTQDFPATVDGGVLSGNEMNTKSMYR